MPLDGLYLNKLLTELEPSLARAKINKVHQPDKNTITLKLNQSGLGNFNLVLSAHPQNARLNISTTVKDNPQSPPPFAMVLRKHIEGGKILQISQKGLDRIAELTIEGRNEIGEIALKRLYVEIMGKHSNIILTTEDQIIIGAIKQYGSNVSSYRQVLPHLSYMAPPPQEKANPFLITEDELGEILLNLDMDTKVAQGLTTVIQGISPQAAQEIVFSCQMADMTVAELGAYECHRLYESLQNLLFSEPRGTLVMQDHKTKDFYFLPLTYRKGEYVSCDNLSQTLDLYFDKREAEAVFSSQKTAYCKTLEQARVKLSRKISKQEKELRDAISGDKYRLYAELLTAYLYQIPQHADSVTLNNFYEAEKPVTIKLRPELSPQDNAARYFRRYNKAKIAKDAIAKQLETNREELTYLENLCYTMESVNNVKDLEVVREEAINSGYLKNKNKTKGKKQKIADALPPHQFTYLDHTILIGRNNKQNDKLTLKIAAKDDIWLHTKDIPGSHVIIKRNEGRDIPPEVIIRAAAAAAYHSKAQGADKVPVDYTAVKQVRKPNGARPGMVIYFEQTTVYVKPEKPDYKEE